MSFLEILSRLFYIGLGAFMGVCAYYICPLQSDVGSGELVAVTDIGNHYITYVTDDDDIRWKPYYVTTLAFENSPGMSILESAKKLDLYF